ncbi:unnamed protein product [Penicillium salamii]|nr:unnamed protein product [Penicillium salamii]CAG8393473.1 unnamed protein product [Penicillium salamii]
MAPVKFVWKTKPKAARHLRESRLDKPPKNPRLRWDREKRFVLCCMYRFCVCNQHQTEKIFSHIFRWHLNERGIMDVVPFRTLSTQWRWMENTGHADWEHVQDITFERSAKALEIMTKIRSAATALSIPLQTKRSHETHPLERLSVETPHTVPETHTSAMPSTLNSSGSRTLTLRHSLIPNRISNRVEPIVSVPVPPDWNFPSARPKSGLETPTTEQQSDSSDSEQGYNEPVVTSHGKTCLWCHQDPENGFQIPESEVQNEETGVPNEVPNHITENQPGKPDLEGLHPDKIPPLLYRWFNEDSQGANSNEGFLSGLFCVKPFNREDISNKRFIKHFIHHVQKEEISTPTKPASLAVFDTTKLKTKVFYAYPIAKYTRTFTRKWQGWGEYLIWGKVPSNAIVFVSPISKIEHLAASHSDINRLLLLQILRDSQFCNHVLRARLANKRKSAYKSGRTFAKLLVHLRFPRLYWEYLAGGFMRCWGWESEEERVNFLKGMKSEFPYSTELSDSESEEPPRPKFKKPRRSPPPSDKDFAPSMNFLDSDSSSESDETTESANESGIMEVRSETVDDGQYSTHESMSSFGFLAGSSRRRRRDGIRSVRMLERGYPSSALRNEISPVVSDQVPSQPAVGRAGVGDLMVFAGGAWSPL